MQQVAATARPRGPARSPEPATSDKESMQHRLATMAKVAERDPEIEQRINEDAPRFSESVKELTSKPLEDRRNGIMPQTMTSVHDVAPTKVVADMRHLPLGFNSFNRDHPDDSGYLPGLAPSSEKPLGQSLPLLLFDAGGGESLVQGNGAPVPLRLFVDIMLCLPSEIRRLAGHQKVFATLRQLRDAIWPNGWQRGRDYPKLIRAMNSLTTSGVPWEGGSGAPLRSATYPWSWTTLQSSMSNCHREADAAHW